MDCLRRWNDEAATHSRTETASKVAYNWLRHVHCSSSNWVLGYGGSRTICGPLYISETAKFRKLNLKITLNMVKYPRWIQKLLYYTILHEVGRHIHFRQMSICLRQTTANNCKTAFSLHVVESTSDDYSF